MNAFIFLKKPLFYINKTWGLCCETAKGDINKFSLFIDYIYSSIRYNVALKQYFKSDFYKKSKFERKNIVTFPWYMTMRLKNNDINYTHYLEDKDKFNRFFSDFIGRDWLLLGKGNDCATIKDFESFCIKHQKFIVKPINLMKGEGIYSTRC